MPIIAADIATARLSTASTAVNWLLSVHGYKQTSTTQVPGDLRFKYTVTVVTVPDVDPQEPNDTMAQSDTTSATQVSVGVGGSTSKTGRISYVGDADYYKITLPSGAASTLHYKITWGTGSRFPAPLPGTLDRLTRVLTQVPLASCQDSPTVPSTACPKDQDNGVEYPTAQETFCQQNLCLWGQRYEDLAFPNLRNLEGVVSIPSGGGTYYLVMQDDGLDWADDNLYTLELDRQTDPDPLRTQSVAMADLGSYSETPGGGATTLTGTINYGYGHLFNNDPTKGQGIRAPHDYDGQVSDLDTYNLTFSPSLVNGWYDRAWELSWSVEEGSTGIVPSNVLVTAVFCAQNGGSCTSVATSASGNPFSFAYTGASVASWQNRDAGAANYPVYSQTTSGAGQVTTALTTGCFCLEPRFVQSGKLTLQVENVDRNTYEGMNYTIHTALAPYPQNYVETGVSGSCPAPVSNGQGGYNPGCLFTQQ